MEIKNLCVSYGQNRVYENFNLSIEGGAVTCILGESGCGKTTLLNAVAGLIPYLGEITKTKFSCVFQEPRLVPNLTVLQNLTLIGAEEGEALAMLKRVGLAEKSGVYPKTLSGGEAQRVSLCRAFLHKAEMLLLDEPFSSLDLKTKLSAMKVFKVLIKDSAAGAIFVTHDIDEALYLSSRIVILRGGKILADLNNPIPPATVPEGNPACTFGSFTTLREKIVSLLTS